MSDMNNNELAERLADEIATALEKLDVPYNFVYIWHESKKIIDNLIDGDGADPDYQ